MNAVSMSTFTPSLMSPDSLEATFVQRHELANRIVDLVRDSALNDTKHHTLLIGPRGIGKTHLISLIYHRVAALDELKDRLAIGWLREEEWGISSFLDVLMRILRALAETNPGADLRDKLNGLYDSDRETAERQAAAILEEFVGNRTLLVLMENLDDIFDGLGDEGQKRLRSYLQDKPYWTIVATSQSLFGGVSRQTSPFYGLFRIEHLGPLSFGESLKLLINIAEHKGDQDLASVLRTPMGRARVRAVHHLAGGNHRVYVIFSKFLTRESLDELVDALMRTIDDLTPYYQSRMAWLSPQQRKIVELLCEQRGAIQVKEIAKACFLRQQVTSSQLKNLREIGYVSANPDGRVSYYELAEPLMRLCIEVKKQRARPIQLLVEFLRICHSEGELRRRLTMLRPGEPLEYAYLHQALKVDEGGTEDPKIAACVRDLKAYETGGKYEQALQVTEELTAIRGLPSDWLAKARCVYQLGRQSDALSLLDQLIRDDPKFGDAWEARGHVLRDLGRKEDALTSFERAVDTAKPSVTALFNRVHLLLETRGWNEAMPALQDAVCHAHIPSHFRAGGTMGILLQVFWNVKQPEAWRDQITLLIKLYTDHRLEQILSAAIFMSGCAFLNTTAFPDLKTERLRKWYDAWQEATVNRDEFAIGLRLLNAVIRLLETKDKRVIHELPSEERKLIQHVLQPQADEDSVPLSTVFDFNQSETPAI